MCCLFGFVDYGHQLTRKQRSSLLSILSTACEERGTDATGIAYNFGGKQTIYKRPLPAHLMWYRVPIEATIVMGHTRMTTQGSALLNQNNHPFMGCAGNQRFMLAHNGVLFNDADLQKKMKLPATKIETDSYVAVQLMERYGDVSFDSLRYMAEQLEGSFTFTVLTDRNALYFVKGNNPMCIYHFPEKGIYIYASTEDILRNALRQLPFTLGKSERVSLYTGEILRIDAKGKQARSHFDDSRLYCNFGGWGGWSAHHSTTRPYSVESGDAEYDYISDLKSVAVYFGLYPEDVDALIEDGISPEEIEEMLYCG